MAKEDPPVVYEREVPVLPDGQQENYRRLLRICPVILGTVLTALLWQL